MGIKTSIIGVSGYTGLELVKLLLGHAYFELESVYASENHADKKYLAYRALGGILAGLVLQSCENHLL